MNLKSVLVLILSAAVLVLGAVLPMAVAGVQDSQNTERVGYASINAVSLEFDESPLTIREKLAVAVNSHSTMDIPEELADHSREEIAQIALEQIAPYQEAGLVLSDIDLTSQVVECYPVLANANSEMERSNVFWYVILSPVESNDKYYWSLYMTLDDETGTLCSIEYSFNAKNETYHQRTGSNADHLLKFCELFIRGLGEEFAGYEPEDLLKEAWTSATGNNIYTKITWGDELYGEVTITFYMTDYGFGTTYYY